MLDGLTISRIDIIWGTLGNAFRLQKFVTHVFADTSLTEELEQLELAQGAQTEHRVVERSNLLNRDLAPTGPMERRADDSIRALADDVEYLVLRACRPSDTTNTRKTEATCRR